MRKINTQKIYDAVYAMAIKCCREVNSDTMDSLNEAMQKETSQMAAFALETIIKSHQIAKQKQIPACQDTGMAVIFLEIGQEVFLEGEYVEDAINRAVKDSYSDGFFRKSTLHPLTRKNFGDNTPAVIHTRVTKGDKVKVHFLAKGFGSENMSKLFMLTPSQGIDGIVDSVVQTVFSAQSNPCPPIVVGVGIGGTMEKACLLAKQSLLRKSKHGDSEIAALEETLLEKINQTKIGAQGFGGDTTALNVFVETFPTHLAGLPVAVNIQCHAVRHETAEI